MKMIGMSLRSPATRAWRPRPFRAGRLTSSTRQLGRDAGGQARKASADAKASPSQPAVRIRPSKASRTDTSSSTTNTVGFSSDMTDGPVDGLSRIPRPLVNDCMSRVSSAKRSVDRLQQGGLAEGLEEAGHCALPQHLGPYPLVGVGGDEDDRDLELAADQLFLELGAANARHGDVEDQARGARKAVRLKKRFGG